MIIDGKRYICQFFTSHYERIFGIFEKNSFVTDVIPLLLFFVEKEPYISIHGSVTT